MSITDHLIIFGANYLIVIDGIYCVSVLLLTVKKKERLHFGLTVIIGAFLALLLAHIGSLLIKDPRPFVVMHEIPLVAHGMDNGFPSDHTLLASFMAAVISLKSIQLGAIAWILALIIGLSRILALVHHPIDIIGSIVIAIVSVWIAQMVGNHIIVRYKH